MIKYVICDIDGVLYNGTVNEKLIDLLVKNKLEIIINSGRGYERIKEVFDKKHLDNFYNIMLVENGAKIINKDGISIKYNPLNDNCINYIKKINKNDIVFANYVRQDFNNYVFYNKRVKNYDIVYDYNQFINNAISDNASRIVFNMKEENLLKYIQLLDNKVEVEISDNKYLMISNKGINKNSAINYLIKCQKFDSKEVAVLGNDYNDISYFKQKKYLKIAIVDENTPQKLINLSDINVKFQECDKIINTLLNYKNN